MSRNPPSLLNHRRITPEFKSILDFLSAHPNTNTWESCIPAASSQPIQRLSTHDIDGITQALGEGPGRPVVIEDAVTTWPAFTSWTFERFRTEGQNRNIQVIVNDRAPARLSDNTTTKNLSDSGGGPQVTVQLPLTDYCNYVLSLPSSLDSIDPTTYSTPFYLNGWRSFFTDLPSLAKDCPCNPDFARHVDDTRALLTELEAQICRKTISQDSSWAVIDESLKKVFVSPPGALTRLHIDAGKAHGWLAQISGRKLFVLISPDCLKSATINETGASPFETLQSELDPFNPQDACRIPHSTTVILHPGQAIIIPKGWWHYAVALDRSITLQKNFYNAKSNANGLAELVVKTAVALKNTHSC